MPRPAYAAVSVSALAVALSACAHLPTPGVTVERGPGVANPAVWPTASSPAAITDARTEAMIDGLLARMTLEEKVGQLIQADISFIKPEDLKTYPLGSVLAGGNSAPGGNERASPAEWLALARAFREAAATRGGAAVPLLFGVDAVHGHNNVVGATVFPHNIGLGAARDPELIRRIGEVTALEAAVTGVEWTFGPTVAVPRDDRWGRTYEGYAEDPEVVAAYAGPMTLGLQGTLDSGRPLAAGRIAGSAKHYLADGGTLNGKDQGDAAISERELIDVHAAGYPPSIDAGVLTVMASFSSWNGVKHTANKSLLTDVLKERMGFQGFVVGDWNAHGQVQGCTNESCPQAITAGLDMFMAPDSWKALYVNTLAQARSGEIPAARVDDAVRRILRVKAKLGLFEGARPLEGRFDRLGATEHRALAREAVRKSMVLLKNEGVLPIRANARVLVAGDGADDIGKQSGGWTITWQGTGNANTDFPNGQSIWAGLKEAVAASGGSAELSADGSFHTKPDVAIVVFGENPYAEFQGDLPNIDFADERPLAILRRLKSQGVPTVAVFLSGRPMWTNPELNASDAFVAAWLPGSEGGGVADVLIGDPAGRPRHDFAGRLSFSWPRDAKGEPLNRGEPGYDPLFAYGYGLSYAKGGRVGRLSEEPGVTLVQASADRLFAAGRVVEPWRLQLSDGAGPYTLDGASGASPGGAVTVRAVDGAAQEDARQIVWSGAGAGRLAFIGQPLDLQRQTNGDMAVALRFRVERAPIGPVWWGLQCGDGCGAEKDAGALFRAAPVGQWRTIKVKLSCLRESAADVSKVTAPLTLRTASPFVVTIAEAGLASNEGDAVCP